MRLAALLLAFFLSSHGALAQQGQRQGAGGKPPAQMSHDERQRLRQDVDSARGNYSRREASRPQRMPPEEREKLRRDVQDANRDMRRR
jgi:hypothetical protein